MADSLPDIPDMSHPALRLIRDQDELFRSDGPDHLRSWRAWGGNEKAAAAAAAKATKCTGRG